jgi:hypothetical protein
MERAMDADASTTFVEGTLRILVPKFPEEPRKPVFQNEQELKRE